MSQPKVLVTGATGFLGSHLVHRLLRAGVRVVALARGSRTDSAEARVRQTVSDVCNDSAENQALAGGLEVVSGDISQSGLGLSDHDTRAVLDCDAVWHSAASLSFLEEDREEIFRMNVEGTRNVIAFTERLRSRRLHHVSTAYVAGLRTGIVGEDECQVDQTFKNPYEASKCAAEHLVLRSASEGGVVPTIYRPSVVIGDYVTNRATHFHGVYVFIRALWSAADRQRRKTGDAIPDIPVRVSGTAESTLNFVPVNYVSDAMLAIGRRAESAGRIYHLTNPVPTVNAVWLKHVCEVVRVRGLSFATPLMFEATPPTRLEAAFQKQMAFYYQYLKAEPTFDCSQTLDALEGTGIRCPEINAEAIHRMIGWYVDTLEADRKRNT